LLKRSKKRDDLENRDVGDDDWCGGLVVRHRQWWAGHWWPTVGGGAEFEEWWFWDFGVCEW